MKFERFFRLSDTPGTGVHCSLQGLFVGQTPLLERNRVQNGNPKWRPRADREITRELGKSYGIPIELASKMSGVAAVARALDREDLVHAQIATLLLRLPDPPKATESRTGFANIVELAKALHTSDLLSRYWDPEKHPRCPAGSPDGVGGEFAPADGAADGSQSRVPITQAQVTIPFPLDIPAPGAIPFPWEMVPPPIVAPNILPRELPTNPYPNRRKCVKEWEEARKYCQDLKDRGLLGRGDYKGMGKTVAQCMRGQVSEDCGGNPVART
jgi:hypothetical protein